MDNTLKYGQIYLKLIIYRNFIENYHSTPFNGASCRLKLLNSNAPELLV
jgi:hypothetical protein